MQLANALDVDVSGFFVPVEGDFKVGEKIKDRVRCVLKVRLCALCGGQL